MTWLNDLEIKKYATFCQDTAGVENIALTQCSKYLIHAAPLQRTVNLGLIVLSSPVYSQYKNTGLMKYYSQSYPALKAITVLHLKFLSVIKLGQQGNFSVHLCNYKRFEKDEICLWYCRTTFFAWSYLAFSGSNTGSIKADHDGFGNFSRNRYCYSKNK